MNDNQTPVGGIIIVVLVIFIIAILGGGNKETYVSPATVRLDGKVYACGTIGENKDDQSLYCRGYKEGYDWATTQAEQVPERVSKWQCKVVVTCPWSDWRYTDPKDVCTYKNEVVYATVNPQKLESYGGSCTEIK